MYLRRIQPYVFERIRVAHADVNASPRQTSAVRVIGVRAFENQFKQQYNCIVVTAFREPSAVEWTAVCTALVPV